MFVRALFAAFILWSIPFLSLADQVSIPATASQAVSRVPGKPESNGEVEPRGTTDSKTPDQDCTNCHQAIVQSYAATGHNLTSQLPNESSIKGKFTGPDNILITKFPDVRFRMEARGDGFYQTAEIQAKSPSSAQPPLQRSISHRIDFVIGSGTRGQTYLYWKGDQLFQLPVSFWAALNGWINSPGYPDGQVNFEKQALPRCLECHATYFKSLQSQSAANRYQRDHYILGISCSRCHGDGFKHVNSASHTTQASRNSIVNPGKLPRERQIEVCSQCHGGLGVEITPAFSYQPGKPLSQYLHLSAPPEDAKVDVHGNQVALLQRSKCYSASSMTCITCHDLHAPEHEPDYYSQRCMNCHTISQCGLFARLGKEIDGKCIGCHMPVQDSDLVVSRAQEREIKVRMRNHWIRVYPELNTLQ